MENKGVKEWERDGFIDGIIGVQWFSMVFIEIHSGLSLFEPTRLKV